MTFTYVIFLHSFSIKFDVLKNKSELHVYIYKYINTINGFRLLSSTITV